ncbi:MAG TPA: hypothetical protein VIL85_00150 [Thermomicrobiales bacterium]|jgi:hypothetical protein
MPPETNSLALTFEDRLRALGWFIDRRELHSVSVAIEQDTVTLAARKRGEESGNKVEIRLTSAEMALLVRDARRRRGNGIARLGGRPSRLNALRQGQQRSVPLSQWVDETQLLSYQELLRAIGFDLDHWRAQSFRLDEFESGLILRVRTGDSGPDVQQVFPLSKEELRTRIAQSIRRRGHQRPIATTTIPAAS